MAVSRARWLQGFAIVVGVLGMAWVADALVITDRENLEAFADDLFEPDGVDEVLARCDVSRVPVTLVSNGSRRAFDEGDELALADVLREELGFVDDPEESIALQSVDVAGRTATIALRTESYGVVRYASFEMARRGDGWLINRIRVSE